MKFKVYASVDYVQGHLRSGHYEGIVEADNIEEAEKFVRKDPVDCDLDFVVDDYRINDIGDIDGVKLEPIE